MGPALTPAFSRIALVPSSAEATTSVVVPSATTWTVSPPSPSGISARTKERSAAIDEVWAGRADRIPETVEAVDHATVWLPSTVTS